jgi:transcriptional regulator with GAF, ATPase, and Fis domain
VEENQALRVEACLVKYDWSGNVRELEHAIERAVLWSCLKICQRRLWKQDGRRQTNPRNTPANAFSLARLQVGA